MFIEADTSSIRTVTWQRPDPGLVTQFAGVAAATIADVLDRMLVIDGAIASIAGGGFVGSALSVLTRGGDNLAIHRAIDEARPGDVFVINGQADLSRAIVGDLLVSAMLAKGVVGVVVDGAVRDREVLSRIGLPVYARGVTPAGPFKVGPGRIGSPVAVGGVVVRSGDIVVADADGVAIVPLAEAAQAIEKVAAQLEVEEGMRRRIRNSLG